MILKYDNYIKLNEEISTANEFETRSFNKIRKCFVQIVNNLGFFAELLYSLNIIEASANAGIDTMATDGKTIAYNPDFVNSLSEAEINFVIIHEVMHNANFHFSRQGSRRKMVMTSAGPFSLWNMAGDYAINLQISDLANEMKNKILKVPTKDGRPSILLDEKYRGLNAEQIYDLLDKEIPESKDPQDGEGQGEGKGKGKGKPSQGSGGGKGDIDPGVIGDDLKKPGDLKNKGKKVFEGSEDLDKAKTEKELEEQWRQLRNNAATKNYGSGSEDFDRWMRGLNKAKVDWKNELRKFVKNTLDKLDFGPWNKRILWRGEYDYGIKDIDSSTFENVVVAIDTSGSITDETLSKFFAELSKIFNSYQYIKNLVVIWCDSDIPPKGIQIFNKVDKKFDINRLKPRGGGGTSFRPPFKWIHENLIKKRKQVAFMIYFTDAFGDAPSENEFEIKKYKNRVLWVVTENENPSNLTFGKKILIDKMPG